MPKVFNEYSNDGINLAQLINLLPQHPYDHDFSTDINQANAAMLSPEISAAEKLQVFFKWCSKYQPCLFGRLSSHDLKSMSLDLCWISDNDVIQGDLYVRDKMQAARRAWKDRAEQGESHGFLVLFNLKQMVFAKPGVELLNVCLRISDLYFVEHAPVDVDVIYTEAMPLRDKAGKLVMFKAGANIFYPGAHLTRNHDRRVPGGLLISINSPGHYLNSLLVRGLVSNFAEAVEYVRDLALRSIGNGGIGHEKMASLTWHNRDPKFLESGCPVKRLPSYIPPDHSREHYSGLYHTDVLVPTSVTVDGNTIDHLNGKYDKLEIWSQLRIDYLVETYFGPDSQNYALFHGHPITEAAKYHNPWPPARPINVPGLAYGEKLGE
jgi:hypothetical protein